MRNTPPFRCPSCGDSALAGSHCVRCNVLLVDQSGMPDVSPEVERGTGGRKLLLAVFGGGVALAGAGLLAGSAPLAIVAATLCTGLLAAGGIKRGLVRNRRARAVARAIKRAGSIVDIAGASGYARVRGRVRVLSPVTDPYGRQVGAFVARKVVGVGGREMVSEQRNRFEPLDFTPLADEGDGMTHAHKGSVTEQHSRCGRFLVTDASGVAVVDEDAFDVWVAEDWAAPKGNGYSIGVIDGATVEIVGPCRERVAADDERTAEVGYRERPTVLAFDGQPGERVFILTVDQGR